MTRKKNIYYGLVCTFLLLVFFEVFFRITLSIPFIANRLLVNDDTTWQRRWIYKHKDMEIYYKFDVYDPTKGWILKPNLRDVKVFRGKILNTNSKGFRGRQEYSYERNPEELRIIVIGDSYTFGEEVNDDETYTFDLQQMIPSSEIINMGIHGYGQDQMLILLKEEGIKYKPDIVILGFLMRDMSRNVLRFRDYAKPKFIIDQGKLVLTNSPVPRPEAILRSDWYRPRIYDFFSILRERYKIFTGKDVIEMKQLTAGILNEIVKTIDSMGAVPIFVFLPEWKEGTGGKERDARDEQFFFSYCRSNPKVQCFSALKYFVGKTKQGIKLDTKGHWGAAGHLTVAESIRDYLAAKGYILQSSNSSGKPAIQSLK